MLSQSAVLVLLALATCSGIVQGANHEGNEFLVAFGPNQGDSLDPSLLVTTDEEETVSFWVAYNEILGNRVTGVVINNTHTVQKGGETRITIPRSNEISGSFTIDPSKTITIKASDDKLLTVVGVNEESASTDAFLALPKIVTKTGTYEYFVMSAESSSLSGSTGARSFFAIITNEDDTTIAINPKAVIRVPFRPGIFRPNVETTATIANKGTIIAGVSRTDLTGSRITSNKPLTLTSGHECTHLPINLANCDHMVEYFPPTEAWGMKFFLVPLRTRSADGYRIMTSKDSTQCQVTCNDNAGNPSHSEEIVLQNAGDFRQFIYSNDRFCCVECTQPCLMVEYSLSSDYDSNNEADPFMSMIPPVQQYSKDYETIFFESLSLDTQGLRVQFDTQMNLVVPVECSPSGLRFDGNPLVGVTFVDIKCNDSSVCGRGAQFDPTMNTGVHNVTHIDPTCKFMFTIYGWDRENSYGYVAGMEVDPIAVTTFCLKESSLTVTEASGVVKFTATRSGPVGQSECIGIAVVDITTQSNDYGTPFNCCFAAGEREATCNITIVSDAIAESDEMFNITLNPSSGQCICEDASIKVTIEDMQQPDMINFALEMDEYTVNETAGIVSIGVVKQSGSIGAGQSITVVVTPMQGIGTSGDAVPATAGADYSNSPVQAVFGPGDSVMSVEIPITVDSFIEMKEFFNVVATLGAGAPANAQIVSPDQATVFIIDAPNTISFEQASYNTTESVGNFMRMRLTSSQPFAEDTNVTISFADITATGGPDASASGVDYGNTPVVVTFAAGSAFSSFASIPINNDGPGNREGTEQFRASFEIPSGYTNLKKGSPSEAVINIVEDAIPTITVQFDPTEYSVSESNGSVKLSLVADQAALESYSVLVTFTDDGATFTEDYLPSSGSHVVSATFALGATEAFVDVDIVEDFFLEEDEQFTAELSIPGSAPDNIQVGDNSEATVTIEDNEQEVFVNFNPVAYNFSEAGDAILTLEASSPAQVQYVVYVDTRNGTAFTPRDYTGGRYEATFVAGSSTAEVAIPIVADGCFDGVGLETFFGDLSISADATAKGVRAGPNTVATVNVVDDDPAPEVNFAPTMYEVLENAGQLTSMLVASEPACEDYDVTVATRDETATSPDDYLGGQADYTVKAGETKVLINTTIMDDDVLEGDENFLYDLTLPMATSDRGIMLGSDTVANTTILDDEGRITVTFSPTTYEVSEEAGNVTLILMSSGIASGEYTVYVDTRDGSAVSPDDYTSGRYMATFAVDSTMAMVVIPLNGDNCFDGTNNEMFFGDLVVPAESMNLGVTAGVDRVATISLRDDEPAPVVNFMPTMHRVMENAGVLTSTLVASEPACEDYDVTVATRDGTATSPDDYLRGQADFTFKAGETEVQINITIMDDDIFEGDEVFFCDITLPMATSDRGIMLGNDTEATTTILDDETGIQVNFAPTTYSVRENAGNVTLILVASGPASVPYTVNVDTRDGSATSPDDYTGGRYQAMFAADSTTAEVVIPIVDDGCFDGIEPEMFFADLSVPTAAMARGVAAGSAREATINVTDNEPAPVVNFASLTYEVMENAGSVTSMVVSSGPACKDYNITAGTRDASAVSPDDFTGGVADFTLRAGSTSLELMTMITDDSLCEGDEFFYCDLSIPTATRDCGITVGSDNEAIITILDDEEIVVNFDPTMYTVNEDDGVVVLNLNLSCPARMEFQVTVTTTNGTATDPDDYIGGEFTVTFTNGSTSAQLLISLTNDEGPDECDETFSARISIPPEAAANAVVAGSDDTATIVIKDDDPFFIDFAETDPDVYENERVYQFCLRHNRTCPDPFSVPVVNMQSGDNPADANDFGAGPYIVNFAEGEKQACGEIPVTQDNLAEPDEQFLLQIMPDPDGVPNIMTGTMDEAQVTIKSVDGDPMFIAPISLPKKSVSKLLGSEETELAICYEVHGAEDKIYNLVSDTCVSVNTHLTVASNPKIGNIMSRIGITAMDNEGQCHEIEADLYKRSLTDNGQAVEGRKQHKGIMLTKMRDRARITVPNCNGHSVVFWVIYHYFNGADMIKFTIGDGHGLRPASHGLMGQFWNTPVEVVNLQEDKFKKVETGDEFKVIIYSSFSGPRHFTGEYYPITWDFQRHPCLYAGLQDGSPVIEGKYTEYEVKSLFDPAFSYSQFSKDRCGKLPVPEEESTNAHAL